MLLLILPLIALLSTTALAFAALNDFLGPTAKARAEDWILSFMGESRGSYALKHMTPFQDHPLQLQTNKVVDAGQAGYVSGRQTTGDVQRGVGGVVKGLGNGIGAVGDGIGG